MSPFTASTRLARNAWSPLATRDTTSSTTTEPDTSGTLEETWKEGGTDVAPGNPGNCQASYPPKWQIRQSDLPDTRNPPQALGYLPVTGGSLPWSGLGII